MPFFQINYENLIFNPSVQNHCVSQSFKCPNYETSWSCPPASPYLKEKLSDFKEYYLIYTQHDITSCVQKEKEKHPNRSIQRIKNRIYWKIYARRDLDDEISKFLNNYKKRYKEKFMLWGGTCRYCMKNGFSECSFIEGIPCRFPEKIQYSMEAIGIDIMNTVNGLDINLEWPPVNYFYWFGLACFK